MSESKRARVIARADDEDDDDLLALADVADQDVFDNEEQSAKAVSKLSSGAVMRLMRNLIVAQPPVLACLGPGTHQNSTRLWDGQRAVDAVTTCAMKSGGIYLLEQFSNDRREGKRDLRVFQVALVGELARLPVSVVMHDEVVAQDENSRAYRTAVELSNAANVTVRVAFHALYVSNGNAAAAYEYLNDPSIEAWTVEQDSALQIDDLLERRLHESLVTKSADEQEMRFKFLKNSTK